MSLLANLLIAGLISLNLISMGGSVNQFSMFLAFQLSLLGGALIAILVAIVRSRNRVTIANAYESLPINGILFLALITGGIFLQQSQNLMYPIISHGVISFAAAAVIAIKVLSTVQLRHPTFNFSMFRSMKCGLPFSLIAGATALNTSIDTLMVNHYLSLNDVAFYNIAQKLSSLVQFSLVIATSLVANKFAQLYANGDVVQLKQSLFTVIKISSSAAFIVLVLIFFASDMLLNLWGESFITAKVSLLILAGAQFINVLFGPLGVLLTMTGVERKVLVGTVCTLIVNIVLNSQLVPLFGINGAAIATATGIIIQNSIFLGLVMRQGVLREVV
ncbi:polysaccharide biosynthesis C-terminal domain-containing protein [Thalassotalea atypica]|uniref:MATE family efflux transporter n=1 Tax=Thalassotalea atypica TaxID=2054316 RepID=UPI0025728153|nr:polysaccharide biosynthesis C-terminal domain-containing protein [Thalassotalea atypica]